MTMPHAHRDSKLSTAAVRVELSKLKRDYESLEERVRILEKRIFPLEYQQPLPPREKDINEEDITDGGNGYVRRVICLSCAAAKFIPMEVNRCWTCGECGKRNGVIK